jgi:hypothetical protein
VVIRVTVTVPQSSDGLSYGYDYGAFYSIEREDESFGADPDA